MHRFATRAAKEGKGAGRRERERERVA